MSQEPCGVPGCSRVAIGSKPTVNGWRCRVHWYGTCDVDGCNLWSNGPKLDGRYLCRKHRDQITKDMCAVEGCSSRARGKRSTCKTHHYGQCSVLRCSNWGTGMVGGQPMCTKHRYMAVAQ